MEEGIKNKQFICELFIFFAICNYIVMLYYLLVKTAVSFVALEIFISVLALVE